MRHEIRVREGTTDGIPYDTLVVDIFEDRVNLQPFRTDRRDDAQIVAGPPVDIDFDTWDQVRDLVSMERGK